MATETKQKPIKEFRFGPIKAAVWRREKDSKVLFSTSITRSYRLAPEDREPEGDDGWRETNNFDFTDLETVKMALEMAQKWIKNELMSAV